MERIIFQRPQITQMILSNGKLYNVTGMLKPSHSFSFHKEEKLNLLQWQKVSTLQPYLISCYSPLASLCSCHWPPSSSLPGLDTPASGPLNYYSLFGENSRPNTISVPIFVINTVFSGRQRRASSLFWLFCIALFTMRHTFFIVSFFSK